MPREGQLWAGSGRPAGQATLRESHEWTYTPGFPTSQALPEHTEDAMSDGSHDPGIRRETGSGRPSPWKALEPRAPSGEDLVELNALLTEHLRVLADSHRTLQQYLAGASAQDAWDRAWSACTRSRVAYERKRDAVLIRTGRI